jgi:serpin B
MPRFGIEARASLGDALIAMGMPLAFDPERADFYGISRDVRRLYIERVIHQANIDVDEKGTEAAAATAVLMGDTSGGSDEAPLVIRADRPFLFLLRDVPTGAILFMGRVADPSIER